MIKSVPPTDRDSPAILVDIGNTSTSVATWSERSIRTPLSAPTIDHAATRELLVAQIDAMPKKGPAAVIIGSVVPEAVAPVAQQITNRFDLVPLIVGDTLELPLDVAVNDRKAVGTDRVCAAAAAFETLKTACVVVDFGSAITVDLISDDGVFQGGAILPGLRMQLRALHEQTAGLPEVPLEMPESAYGRNTAEAMQVGVCRGVAGAVRGIVEGYATSLSQWPQVVATGGDAAFMAPHCDFFDTLVEHLTLRGIGLAYEKHLTAFEV